MKTFNFERAPVKSTFPAIQTGGFREYLNRSGYVDVELTEDQVRKLEFRLLVCEFQPGAAIPPWSNVEELIALLLEPGSPVYTVLHIIRDKYKRYEKFWAADIEAAQYRRRVRAELQFAALDSATLDSLTAHDEILD